VIAGDGPDLDRLRAAAGAGAELLGGVSEADKQELLAEAWLLVHPAAHEGWGTVIMEAAALGTPTVAFDVRGVRDSVVDGETGVLAADEDAFVAAWSRLAADRVTRDRFSEQARARAATFTWQRAVDEFDAVAHEAVDRDRTA
jgi:glycosyltransferase involved in cell wall biosynthesis